MHDGGENDPEEQVLEATQLGELLGIDQRRCFADRALHELQAHQQEPEAEHEFGRRQVAATNFEDVGKPADGDQRDRERTEVEFESERRDEPTGRRGAEVRSEDHRQRIAHLDDSGAHEREHQEPDDGARLQHRGGGGAAQDAADGVLGIANEEFAQSTARKRVQGVFDERHREEKKTDSRQWREERLPGHCISPGAMP